MSTVVEVFCEGCYRETFHMPQVRDTAVCLTCGTVSEFINSNGNSGTSGIGVSGVGESGEGETPSSLPPTTSTPNANAEMLHGKGLVALDGDPGLARFVFDKAGLDVRPGRAAAHQGRGLDDAGEALG